MSWLEEAKKRAEIAREIWRTPSTSSFSCAVSARDIVLADAPHAYALLERAKVLMDHHIYVCEVHNLSEGVAEVEDFLRDLEKGPSDVA